MTGKLLEYRGDGCFELSPEGEAVLSDENHPAFGAGFFTQLPAQLAVTERLPAAVAVIDGAGYVVDTTGYVVGPKKRGEFEHLPLLTGLDGFDRQRLAATLVNGVPLLRDGEHTGAFPGRLLRAANGGS